MRKKKPTQKEEILNQLKKANQGQQEIIGLLDRQKIIFNYINNHIPIK